MAHRLIQTEKHSKPMPTVQLALASCTCALAAGIMLDINLSLQLCILCVNILKGLKLSKLLGGVDSTHMFITLGTMFTSQQLAGRQTVFIPRHQLFNDGVVNARRIQEIRQELWQRLQRMWTNAAMVERSYQAQPSGTYPYPHQAQYVGIMVMLSFTEATVHHTLLTLEIDDPVYTEMVVN
ncbi:hypothetical protein IWQ61_007558 [Dispira simplex]|nr:hypothetical protein IWQ61_007558 [Dispira simplex]